MKLQICGIFGFILLLASCKKDTTVDMNPAASKVGYVLTDIAIDTLSLYHIEYNDKNQVTKMSTHFFIYDSIIYNSKGQLVKYKATRIDPAEISDISLVYDTDTILKKVISRNHYSSQSDVVKYILSGNKVVGYMDGFTNILEGKTYFLDTLRCVYKNENVSNRSDNHNFEYDERFYNPYLTLGNHTWYLLSQSWDIVFGESENMLSIDSYVESPPPTPSETTYEVLSAFEGNKLLPRAVKQKYSNGAEFVYTYSYMKKK